MHEIQDPRHRVLASLKRHGSGVTSFQVLERGFSYWFDEASRACFGYVDTGAAWVVAGTPIGPRSGWELAVARFAEEAARARRRACFFAVDRDFLSLPGVGGVQIGEEPWWAPAHWDAVLGGSRSLREQLRRARAKGVRVRAVEPSELRADAPLRRAIEGVIAKWLATRKMPPMGFLTDVQPFEFEEERRYFVAERGGSLVGFLAAVPVFARNAWFCEDLLRTPDAPNGTNELLFDAAIRRADRDGATGITLGLAPLSGDVGGLFRVVRASTRWLYDFHGVRAFKGRLSPERWEPVFLAWPRGTLGAAALVDSLTAFTLSSGAIRREPAGLVRFACKAVTRSRTIAVRVAVAVLLVVLLIGAALAGLRDGRGDDHARLGNHAAERAH